MSRRREETELQRALALSTQQAVIAARLPAVASSGTDSGSQDSKDMELKPCRPVAAESSGAPAANGFMPPPAITPASHNSGDKSSSSHASAIASFSATRTMVPPTTTPSSPILPYSRAPGPTRDSSSSATTGSRPLFSPTQISANVVRESLPASLVTYARRSKSPSKRVFRVSSSPEPAPMDAVDADAIHATGSVDVDGPLAVTSSDAALSSTAPQTPAMAKSTPAASARISNVTPRGRDGSVDPLDQLNERNKQRAQAMPVTAMSSMTSSATSASTSSRRVSSRVADHKAKEEAEKAERRRLRAERKEREARAAAAAATTDPIAPPPASRLASDSFGPTSTFMTPRSDADTVPAVSADRAPTDVAAQTSRPTPLRQPRAEVSVVISSRSGPSRSRSPRDVPEADTVNGPTLAEPPATAESVRTGATAGGRKRPHDDDDSESDIQLGRRAKKPVKAAKKNAVKRMASPLPEAEAASVAPQGPAALSDPSRNVTSVSKDATIDQPEMEEESKASPQKMDVVALESGSGVGVTSRQRSPLAPIRRNFVTPSSRPSPGPDAKGIKWRAPRNDLTSVLAKYPAAKAAGMSRRIRIAPLHAKIGPAPKALPQIPNKKQLKIDEGEDDEFEGLDDEGRTELRKKRQLEWMMTEDPL